jgi:AraC-like DNA-binding protein
MHAELVFIVTLFGSLLGLIVSAILYFGNKNQSLSPRILAATVLCISYTLIIFGWHFSGTFLKYPHLWRTGAFFTLCVPPLSYLYVRSVLEQQFWFRKTDLLLFMPAVLYTLQMVPFYILPASSKYESVVRGLNDRSLIALEPEGMLPLGVGIIFRMVFGLTMVMMQIILIGRYRKKVKGLTNQPVQNIQIVRWLFYFSIVMGSTFGVLLLEYIFQMSRFIDIWELVTFTVCGNILFISFYLLFRPNILYGLQGWFQDAGNMIESIEEVVIPEDHGKEEMQSVKKQTLSLEQGKLFKQLIEDHFKNSLPFRKQGYTIRDLSMELSVPTYQLSVFINQEYGKNFNEFVNDNRVEYLQELVKVHPEYLQYTLEALGQMAGFNSRTAFIAAVKRKTGKKPSEEFSKKYSNQSS